MFTQTSKLNKFFFIIILSLFLFYSRFGALPEVHAENTHLDTLPEHLKKQITKDKKKDQNKEDTLYELSQDQFGQPVDTQKYKPASVEQTQKNEEILQTDQEQQRNQIEPVQKKNQIEEDKNKITEKETKVPYKKGGKEAGANSMTDPINKQDSDLNHNQVIQKEKSTTIYNPNVRLKHNIKNFPSPSMLNVLLNFLLKLSTVILSCIALLLSYKALKTAKKIEEKMKNELKIEM